MLKLGFEKAFDNVGWSFLLGVLHAKVFGDRCLLWIEALLSSLRASVLINGATRGSFPIRKVLKQGCPLSPLLFILATDVLLMFIVLFKAE